jgi:hypothetical protein
MRRRDPVAGTHDQGRWLWVPALAALGQDDDGSARTNLRLLESNPGSDPLFWGCYLQWMVQLQRVEPSVRGDSDHALGAVGSRGAGCQRGDSANEAGGKTAATIRPGAPAPTDANEPWRPSLGPSSGHKEKPPAGCPAGGRCSSRYASIKERCRGGHGCEVRSCPDSGSGRRPSAWRCCPAPCRSRWPRSMPTPASGRSHRSPHRTTV